MQPLASSAAAKITAVLFNSALPPAILLFAILLSSPLAFTLEITESFTDLNHRDDSTLVWNSALGELHPPLFVKGYVDAVSADRNFEVGDGRHGAFVESRYEEFSENGDVSGQVIRLNTDEFPFLYVTEFVLEPGWIIEPTGSLPLKIHSLSSIVIKGKINCSGENGEDILAPNTSVALGGEAHCGGGRGGNGASATTPAEGGVVGGPVIVDGVSVGVDGPTVGGAASHDGLGAAGGGGGSYQKQGIGLSDSSAGSAGGGGTGGAKGEMAPNHDFELTGGGFGGGGGDYSAGSSGGGGGAGGGTIYMFAVGNIDVHVGGEVLANGGNGGGGANSFTAGGGGGGGGGSILMFAGGDVRLAGVVTALKGTGGSDAGETGGDGADGRSWLVGSSGFSTNLGSDPFAVEIPDYELADPGLVRFRTDTIFNATSKSFDLLNSKPLLSSMTRDEDVPGTSQLSVEWSAGTTYDFTPVTWNSLTSSFEGARYIKFRVSIDNQDEVTPAKLREVVVSYSPYTQTDFQFAGGCGKVTGAGSSGNMWMMMFCLFAPLALIFVFKFLMYRRANKPELRLP